MIFLTGFPGFIGTRLVRRLAERYPKADFALLVQPQFVGKAAQVLDRLELAERAEIIAGDITKMDLGIQDGRTRLQMNIKMAFHLAAAYDLSVSNDVAEQVNVRGTRHVLNFLEPCPNLEVFGYVSTAYVSGKRTGAIYEDELRHDAGFKNHYERSKYDAEILVQERMDSIPTVVLRPSIVVGDSQTGEAEKLDGPYTILRLLRYLPRYAVITRLGAGTRPVNLIPVDFATQAITELTRPELASSIFHLTDPNPFSTQEIVDIFLEILDKEAAIVPVPVAIARLAASTPAGWFVGLTPQIIDYFDHPAYYDSANAQAILREKGVECPLFSDYAPKMVDYLRQHEREMRSSAMY